MVTIPKNMDEFMKMAKDVSVKVADTVGKLCNSYVEKSGTVEAKPAEAQAKPATTETPKAEEAKPVEDEASK